MAMTSKVPNKPGYVNSSLRHLGFSSFIQNVFTKRPKAYVHKQNQASLRESQRFSCDQLAG